MANLRFAIRKFFLQVTSRVQNFAQDRWLGCSGSDIVAIAVQSMVTTTMMTRRNVSTSYSPFSLQWRMVPWQVIWWSSTLNTWDWLDISSETHGRWLGLSCFSLVGGSMDSLPWMEEEEKESKKSPQDADIWPKNVNERQTSYERVCIEFLVYWRKKRVVLNR